MWDKIIALNREKRILQKAILENRLASAYCFIGNEGIGKDAVALELAKTANCYHPIISDEIDDTGNTYQYISACECCKSCKMANSLSHPNIQYIFALPGGNKMKEEDIKIMREQLALKHSDPYHKINIPNAKYINIATVREITKNSAYGSDRGQQFIIISGGEQMNNEAANAFLKTLEEPPNNTTIIITTGQKEKLLQTILSRCQQIYFNPIPFDDLVNYLINNYSKSEVEARLIAAFGQGSITKAVESFDDNMNKLRSDAVDMLRIALKRRVYRIELLNMIEKLLELKDKKLFTLFLNLLLIWVRDVFSIAKTGEVDLVINVDLQERMVKFHNGFPDADLLSAIEKIENAISKIDYNIDPKLTYISLFIDLRRIFLNVNY